MLTFKYIIGSQGLRLINILSIYVISTLYKKRINVEKGKLREFLALDIL